MGEIVHQLANFVVVQHVLERRHLFSPVKNLVLDLILVQALADSHQRRSAIRADAIHSVAVLAAVLLEQLRPGGAVGA